MIAIYEWLSQQKNEFDRIDTLDCTSTHNGKVYVRYVIDEQGHLTKPEIEKGIGDPYDNYCLQLIRDLPIKWIPGTKDGKPIKVLAFFPFSFCKEQEIYNQKTNKKRKKK